jgi:hypothetical protein
LGCWETHTQSWTCLRKCLRFQSLSLVADWRSILTKNAGMMRGFVPTISASLNPTCPTTFWPAPGSGAN